QFNEYVFYLGRHYHAREMPWHFPFVMLGVATPLVVLAFFLVSLGILAVRVVRARADRSPLVLLALWVFVPTSVQAFTHAVKMDGVRHYLLVLPAIAL